MKWLILFLLPHPAFCLDANTIAVQTANAAKESTALATQHTWFKNNNCSGTIRAANWGHSISIGQECDVRINDAYRRTLTPAMADKGYLIKWVGVQHGSGTTVLQCPGTNLPGVAPTIQMVYDNIVANAATEFANPTANDWAFIGPTLTNNATQGATQSYMQTVLIACITVTAAVIPQGKIIISNDIPRLDGVSLTNALAAANYAYTWTKAQGYNVYFLDINTCTVALCSDNLHPTYGGQDDWGNCMASLLKTALGL